MAVTGAAPVATVSDLGAAPLALTSPHMWGSAPPRRPVVSGKRDTLVPAGGGLVV